MVLLKVLAENRLAERLAFQNLGLHVAARLDSQAQRVRVRGRLLVLKLVVDHNFAFDYKK